MFDVSRSGYYRFTKAHVSKRAKENELLLEKIKKVHIKSRQTYGSPRIQAELKSQGFIARVKGLRVSCTKRVYKRR